MSSSRARRSTPRAHSGAGPLELMAEFRHRKPENLRHYFKLSAQAMRGLASLIGPELNDTDDQQLPNFVFFARLLPEPRQLGSGIGEAVQSPKGNVVARSPSGQPAEPAVPPLRRQPRLARARHARTRPHSLDADPRPHRPPSPPLGGENRTAAAVLDPRSPGPTRPPRPPTPVGPQPVDQPRPRRSARLAAT